ncbi:MAG: hypothetical protein HY758_02920 [Nitrospirae bacterium]|nr:hypothetical protein [Nitrospirota bacterium]
MSDVYTMSPEIAIRDQAIKPLYESKTPFEIMMSFSDALIKNGDPDIRLDDFSLRYKNEEDFINEIIAETPGFCNTGKPLPYPDLPEGSLIIGTPDDPGAVLDGKIIKKGERLTVEWLRQHHGVAVWPAGYFRYKRSDGSPSGIYPATSSKRFEFAFSYLAGLNSKFGTDYPTTFYWSGCRWNPQNTLFSDLKREYPFQLITGRVHHAMTMTAVCPYLAETETECMKPLNNDFRYHMPDLENMPNKYGIPAGKQTIFNTGSVSIPVFAFNRADAERIGIETGDLVMLETPFRKSVKGKVYVTDEVIPGVIKTAFGPGGHRSSGIGFVHNTSEYTPNINDLFDPANISGFTGMPGFGDIMVRVIHLKNKGI